MNNILKFFGRIALCATLVCPALVSCHECPVAVEYDDTAIKEQIESIINRLLDLEEKVNSEIKALKAMIDGKITIKSVVTDAKTGVTTVTFTNGTDVKLYPEADLESCITYITSGGVKYWAYIDENGVAQYLHDENGKGIPVEADTPEVIVEDGETYLVIGGVKYPFSGNSVFSDYEVITDEYTGEVYAVTFTFGKDMSFTVTVDGAAGFSFIKNVSPMATVAISDFYVPVGTTNRVQFQARGVVDYIVEKPEGWGVKEYVDDLGSYFDITAPSAEVLGSGAAEAEGVLKVMAVLEGGKATIAKLVLSVDPFEAVGVSFGKANVKMRNGLVKFAYGICEKSLYDEAAILAEASKLLVSGTEPAAGYGISDFDIQDLPLSTLAGKDLTIGGEYVFWALPAAYSDADAENLYSFSEGTFVTCDVVYSSVSMKVTDETNRDARLELELKGVQSFYFDVEPKSFFSPDIVVELLNIPGAYEVKTGITSYDGSLFELAGKTAEQETEYVAWIALNDGGEFTVSDLLMVEFSTLGLTAGGTITPVPGDVKVTAIDVEVPLTAAGAEKIYYLFAKANETASLDSDEKKIDYLFKNCRVVEGESVYAMASDMLAVQPDTDYVLLAAASGPDGKYGSLLYKTYKTEKIVYNDLKITASVVKNDPGNVVLSVSSEGAAGYLYWIGKLTDNAWDSPNYLGGNATRAEGYMYLNAKSELFASVMQTYPIVDGKITLTDLEVSTDYVLVIMAKDDKEHYSHAVELRFNPNPVKIGTIVLDTDPRWKQAKPMVDWLKDKFEQGTNLSGKYGYLVSLPEGYTSYVMSGTDAYFTEGNEDMVPTMEQKIVSIMTWANRSRDTEIVVNLEEYTEKGYPYGHEFYHYSHGCPDFGYAVVWPSEEFHKNACGCGEEGYIERTYQWNSAGPVKYKQYYKIVVNDGNPIEFYMDQAIGNPTEVVDRVFIVCQDAEGNCYQPYEFDVPVQYFNK